jgi:hypothetical protein
MSFLAFKINFFVGAEAYGSSPAESFSMSELIVLRSSAVLAERILW